MNINLKGKGTFFIKSIQHSTNIVSFLLCFGLSEISVYLCNVCVVLYQICPWIDGKGLLILYSAIILPELAKVLKKSENQNYCRHHSFFAISHNTKNNKQKLIINSSRHA